MRKRIFYKDPATKKRFSRVFDTEKSAFICRTPQGKLYKKKTSHDFFLWKDDNDPITVSWADANALVSQYGTREQHLDMFTVHRKSTTPKTKGRLNIALGDYHKIKAQRNASRLGLSVRAYICRLIDKDDASHNFCK